ncbi:hypothetical protein BH09ACT11_BH09ACT11_02850 [soil metagenome]
MRIAAVVVTWNRLPVLQRLLQRLDLIVGLDEVLVIDNCSTDGTSNWLAGLDQSGSAITPATPVLSRTLAENTGGAGGFHTGIGWAVERGADLVWLFDDDAMPDPDCLAQLLEHRGLDFWGPVVVDEDAADRLVFPIRVPGRSQVLREVPQVRSAATDGVLDGIVIPFNGVLVTRELVEQIGLPRSEYFIWGDDHEYRMRAEAAGARIGTVVDAVVRHPSVGELGTPMAFGRTTYNHTPSDLKHYCMARNNLINLRSYRGSAQGLAFVLKTLWFYLFTRPDPARIRLSTRAWRAALKGDFTGHLEFLVDPGPQPGKVPAPAVGTVAAVVVTWNRADLLRVMLSGLAAQTRPPDAVIVIDNASTDHTAQVLADAAGAIAGLQVVSMPTNLGGAGGFQQGMRAAREQGFDRIWLMDDDVVPAPDCLEVLLDHGTLAHCLMSVRESTTGALAEYAATEFDLSRPWVIKPKTASVVSTYSTREAMPDTVALANVAFEGFMVTSAVVDAIGLPDAEFFIFYDDCDYALRARKAGFEILAVRDARLIRQLDHDQQHDLAGWKGYYMFRNLFVVHRRHGTNALVRMKPWAIAAAVALRGVVRGRRGETRNVVRALKDSRRMDSRRG